MNDHEPDGQNGSVSSRDSGSERRRSSTKSVLIEKDGKTVSKTSTGKRKFHNKSKLGCDTCKRRRVKCDEGKPVCKKCLSMSIECTYSMITTPANPTTPNSRAASLSGPASSPSPPPPQHPHRENLPQKQDPPQNPQKKHKVNPVKLESNPLADLLSGAKSFSDLLSGPKNLEDLMRLGALAGFGPGAAAGPPNGGDMTSKLINAAKAHFLQSPKTQPQNGNFHQGIPFPSITVKSPSMDPASLQAYAREYSMNATNGGSDSNNNLNSLAINMMTTDNPTISPQPTMSPGSTHSPISLHQRPAPMASAHDFNTQMDSMSSNAMPYTPSSTGLNLIDLKLMYHYTTTVAPTITTAGISEKKIWMDDIPQLAFEYSFLMHSILAFSATHLSRTEKNMERYVTYHRGEALRLLREAVLEISAENTDALVASALILIMDSLANASLPSASSATSLPASAWIFHVKGAATILTAVWPLPQTSRFYTFISVDLSDLGDIINDKDGHITDLVCFDESIADLYPVEYDSPYLITLAYLDKLHKEKYKSDFILRVFAFPALLDKTFLALLMSGDLSAMRIMRSYYTLLRGFTTEMKDKVWFLEGVSNVLPADVDDYTGGGGMHMMLDFLGGGLPSMATSNMSSGLNIDINDHFMNP